MKHATAGFSAKFPKLAVESSLYRTWILQLESFIIIAIASHLMTAPGAQWNEHSP